MRRYGDRGLKELTKKFDGVEIGNITVSSEELNHLADSISQDVRESIDLIYEHMVSLNKAMVPKDLMIKNHELLLGILWRPIDSVGIYVPGGLKAYPSTLLMAAIPARIAGVSRLFVATPPRKDGSIDPAVAYITRKLGVCKVYRVGGAQIIAAMAYGTESVDKVDKIVGPGNIYVQVAKFLVQGIVSIDGVAGPTELVVIADESAKPDQICVEMEAQAEHGPTSVIILISTSDELLSRVEGYLSSSRNTFFLIKVSSIDEAITLVNDLAPEHLSLHVQDPYMLVSRVKNVGAISLGRTPSAIVDYLGPNHILPTSGSARFRGGLSVYDFLKTIMVADGIPSNELLRALRVLARYEGFKYHSRSVEMVYGVT